MKVKTITQSIIHIKELAGTELSPSTIHTQISRGRFPGAYKEGIWFLPVRDIENYIENHMQSELDRKWIQYEPMIGKLTDVELAKRMGISSRSVYRKRIALGIEPYNRKKEGEK